VLPERLSQQEPVGSGHKRNLIHFKKCLDLYKGKIIFDVPIFL